jgi:N-acyl-D-amino-acid deacylase
MSVGIMKMKKSLLCLAALGLGFLCVPALGEDMPFDVIIANGHVIDGTGSPWYSADVGIREGRIAAIGK